MQRAAATSLRRSLGLLRVSFHDGLQACPLDRSASVEGNWAVQYCRSYATRAAEVKPRHSDFGSYVQHRARSQCGNKAMTSAEVQQDNQSQNLNLSNEVMQPRKKGIGENISSKDKNKFLLNTLFDLKDSKEAVYGALDSWVAWERNFPLVQLKRAIIALAKEEQWHRVVQVIKWMLSKGQGTTMGTYEQLIRSLEKDHRAEEAHRIWVKKIGDDLHSVPWRVCDLMISIYYRNNMLERLVKLFKGLESYDRQPPSKSIVRKVADAYEMLGLLDEKNRVLEKYNDLFSESSREVPRKSRKFSRKLEKKAGNRKPETIETSDDRSAACAVENDKECGGVTTLQSRRKKHFMWLVLSRGLLNLGPGFPFGQVDSVTTRAHNILIGWNEGKEKCRRSDGLSKFCLYQMCVFLYVLKFMDVNIIILEKGHYLFAEVVFLGMSISCKILMNII